MGHWYRAHPRIASFFGVLLSYAMFTLIPSTTYTQSSATVPAPSERSTSAGTLFIQSPFQQNFLGPYQLYSAAFQIRSERTALQLAVYTMRPISRVDRMIAGYLVGDPIIDFSYSVLLHRASNTSGFFTVSYFPLYTYGLPGQPATERILLAHFIPVIAGLHVGTWTFGMYLSDMSRTNAGKRLGIEYARLGIFIGTYITF